MEGTTTSSEQRPHLLINRNFACLWTGQTISNAGDLFFDTTLSLWIATQLAKGQSWAPLAISGVALAAALPTPLVGPFAGVFADRWNKRQTMLWMDLGRALIIGVLFLVALFARHLPVPLMLALIYLTCALENTLAQFFNPARMTFIKDIVPVERLTCASGLSSASFNLALIIGPILAAPLYFAVGAEWAIAFNAVSFLASWLAIFVVRVADPVLTDKTTRKERSDFWHDFWTGLRFYRANHVLMALLIAGIFFNLGAGALNALYVLFVIQNLHTPQNLIGLFATLYGAGVISGSLLSAFFMPSLKEARVFWLALLGWGCGMVIFACTTSFLVGLVFFLFLGFCNAGIIVVVGPLKLRVMPREFVGRAEAVMTPLTVVSQLFSVILASSLASTLLAGVHFSWLHIAFSPLTIVFLGGGCISMLAGIYALLTLRHIVIP